MPMKCLVLGGGGVLWVLGAGGGGNFIFMVAGGFSVVACTIVHANIT